MLLRSILSLGALALGAGACDEAAPVYSGTVCFEVRHHGLAVSEATIYHRAGGAEPPGFVADMAAAYDTSVFTGLGAGACLAGLGLGRHYFAAQAYDPLIRDSVLGSISLELTVRARTVDTVLQVSERH